LFKIWKSKKNKSLFVKIAFQGNFDDFKNTMYGDQILDLRKHMKIVSVENAIHQSEGWHVNNFYKFKKNKIALKDLTKEIYGFKKR
jgi:hypothetical protein